MRNAAGTLPAALASLRGQTLQGFKVVLVDDGSSDDSVAVAKAHALPGMKVLRQRPLGVAAALNHGLEHCRTPYVARADADDLNEPQRLQVQLAFLAARPHLAGVGSDVEYFGGLQGRRSFPNEPDDIAAAMVFECSLCHPTMLLRRESLAGGYPATLCEDYALWSRLLMHGRRLASLPKALVRQRMHAGQVTALRRQAVIAAAHKVRRSWLKKLGILPTQRELLIHRGREKGLAALDESERWLDRLEDANLARGLFDPQVFARALHARWHLTCFLNRPLGLPVLRRYLASPRVGPGPLRALLRILSNAPDGRR